ncbi:hypothetical protein XA68_10306 [Ophiocordyceps unilateralis]|uniref:Essential protein Yae1 N-terminal domain-containing protein n=1 Tax=Ophiocordyceps unilateralis TaxID=268505 RepID=A0A2A9PIQ2_OPHUN|nr:hypothetical protein XA68_10306 [Ophiocordyceps unilateralis]
MTPDPLEDVLQLEERYYREGYQQGLDDGARAGRIEGRSFGMEKGYEKFLEGGRLAGKAVVWANRLTRREDDATSDRMPHRGHHDQLNASQNNMPCRTDSDQPDVSSQLKRCVLPPLPSNPRTDKNVRALYALVEPGTLSTENTDEAVQDFDSRMKRAQGKAKMIERVVG